MEFRTQPMTQPMTQPTTQAMTQSTAQAAAQPATQAMQTATQPTTQTTTRPTTQPAQTPARPGGCEQGILPACAPLANPFVPFQQDNPPTYPAKKGVVRGTLFPSLDLPFMGMVNNQELSATDLHELQALGFAVVELGEYLDTHANDQEALALFRSYVDLYEKGVEAYQKTHGPLMQRQSGTGGSYNWLNEPWPWEYEANATKEG